MTNTDSVRRTCKMVTLDMKKWHIVICTPGRTVNEHVGNIQGECNAQETAIITKRRGSHIKEPPTINKIS